MGARELRWRQAVPALEVLGEGLQVRVDLQKPS